MAALVDTSAWIEFFRARGAEPVKRAIRAALQEGAVVTTAPVLTELLVGLTPGRATHARAIELLRALETVELSWDVCERAGALGRLLARRGQRVPSVDLMIAGAAVVCGHEVWHVGDQHFAVIEQVDGPRQLDLTTAANPR